MVAYVAASATGAVNVWCCLGIVREIHVVAIALVEASVATGVMQEAMDVCSGQSEPTTTDAQ